MNIENYKNILNQKDYLYLIHNISTKNNPNETVSSIFSQGLKVIDSNLNHNTIKIANGQNYENLIKYINNCDSNEIILIRLPLEYINPITDNNDDFCTEKYHVFYTKINLETYIDPKFIVGCFNTQTQDLAINPNFEPKLTLETKKELGKKLEEAIDMTLLRIEKSMNTSSFKKIKNDDWEK